MPQLIAMIIIVVGAMIYMFQTFGGTGDKITGMAQKTSIISEINNIKSGLQFAARDKVIYETAENDTDASEPKANNLLTLARLSYFADQINSQIMTTKAGAARANKADFNIYSAISFGGNSVNAEDENGDMLLYLVAKQDKIPGIFVDLSRGGLKDTADFLEQQIATDLKGIAFIDRGAKTATAGTVALDADDKKLTGVNFADKIPGKTAPSTVDNLHSDKDGMFIVYFSDFASTETVK